MALPSFISPRRLSLFLDQLKEIFASKSHTHTKSQISDMPTSMPNPYAITISLNGGTSEGSTKFTYNGSSNKSLNISPGNIGAATSGHTHSPASIGAASTSHKHSVLDISTDFGDSVAIVSNANGQLTGLTNVSANDIKTLQGISSNIQDQLDALENRISQLESKALQISP